MSYVGPQGAAFLPGLDLSNAFYDEAVEPILRRHFPDLPYAAARIGPGSDVLGFDDRRSTDHFWGPLLNVFLSDEDLDRWGEPIRQVLAAELPFEVRGFSLTSDPSKATRPTLATWATWRRRPPIPSTTACCWGRCAAPSARTSVSTR
jgi:hypothetical protein